MAEPSSGREHYERRISQQRAADKRRVKQRHEYVWLPDETYDDSDEWEV